MPDRATAARIAVAALVVLGACAQAQFGPGAGPPAPVPAGPAASVLKQSIVAQTPLGPIWRSECDISAHADLTDGAARPTGPAEIWGPRRTMAFFRGSAGLEVAVRDGRSGTLKLIRIGRDGDTTAVDLPGAERNFVAMCRDYAGNCYYYTHSGGNDPRAVLTKAGPKGELVATVVLGCSEKDFNLYNLDGCIANLSVAGSTLCLLGSRTMQDHGDGLHHQGSFCAFFRTEDLSLVINHGQNAGHSFDNRLVHDGRAFISIDLGDNYPRGIVLHRITATGKVGRVVFTYKTAHGTGPHPHRKGRDGQPLPAGQWSNDNRTYTALADVVPTSRGYLVGFASEMSTDNALTQGALNEPRNVGVVLVASGFDTAQQQGSQVSEEVVISRGTSSPPFGYYTFDGGYVAQRNVGVVWLTNYTAGTHPTAAHPRLAALGDGRYLAMWEVWTDRIYQSTRARLLDEMGAPLGDEMALGSDVPLPRGEDLVVADGCLRWPAVEGGKLVIYTWQTVQGGQAVAQAAAQPPAQPPAVALRIADPALERELRRLLRVEDGPLSRTNLASISGVLDLSGRGIADISGLEALTGVTDLNLGGNGIADLSPLAGLRGLRRLSLPANRISDLSPLADLAWLQYLDLNDNKAIIDLTPLAGLTALQELHLNRSRITDLKPLGNLRKLTTLNLEANQVADISPLAGLTALTWLHLGSNQVRDLGPVSSLTGLTWLAVGGNLATDLSPLTPLVRLQNLSIDRLRVSDLRFLSGARDLRTLGATGCGLRSLDGIGTCPGLLDLYAAANLISDLQPIAGLARLCRLDVSSNRISDLSALRKTLGLVSLNLAWNRVPDLTPLSGLASLEDLELGWTGATDVSALQSLRRLKRLSLRANPLQDVSPLALLTGLESLSVEGSMVADISGLTPFDVLPGLKALALQGTRLDRAEGSDDMKDVAALRERHVDVQL